MVTVIKKLAEETTVGQWLMLAVQAPAAAALIIAVWQMPDWIKAIQGGYESNAQHLNKAAAEFRQSVQMLIDDRRLRDKTSTNGVEENTLTGVQ